MQKHLKENGKQNIILLGGSNSVMVNGLQKDIREGIAKLNERKDEKGHILQLCFRGDKLYTKFL